MVSELDIYQNARCNSKNYVKHIYLSKCLKQSILHTVCREGILLNSQVYIQVVL